ncbi:MAG: tetratricopeptide repeat protein [Steroidobacteraceae bacterium]
MWRLSGYHVKAILLLAGTAAGAQVPNSSQNVKPSDNSPEASTTAASEATATPSILKPGVTVAATRLHSEPTLPKLPADEFVNCERMLGVGTAAPKGWQVEQCQYKMAQEENIVLRACYDLGGKTAPRRVIQACTEALDRKILEIPQRSFLFVARADAYFALGHKQRALDDYNAAIKLVQLLPANERFLLFAPRADEYLALGNTRGALDDYDAAIKSAPHNAALYYNRGVVFIAQANYDAALRDLDTALEFNSKFVPALRQRARIYATRGNLVSALADYSGAIRLQPKAAALWSDRGQLDLDRHQYGTAIEDEAHAIQLDPKLASAYYLRSVAFGYSGDRSRAVSDLQTAVGLDPSLANYVTIKGKTVVLGLPPL